MSFEGIWEAMVMFIIVCMVAAFVLGAALMWIAPIAWEWIRPWLHAATA